MMVMAFKHGVNFFDTSEMYGDGQAEELLGGAIKKGVAEGVWSREDLVVSTKPYSAGTLDSSHFAHAMFKNSHMTAGFEERVKMTDKPIAAGLGYSLAQLSMMWAAANENVSTVLVGDSRPSQLEESLKLQSTGRLSPPAQTGSATSRNKCKVPAQEGLTILRCRDHCHDSSPTTRPTFGTGPGTHL
ncbi:hypothetical protein BBJ28_00027253 [Nothophytophthora sp. Chile5]|nr:hypothetical protein BBJ28_00027253 [Nothophytophthora sp. Chile5]